MTNKIRTETPLAADLDANEARLTKGGGLGGNDQITLNEFNGDKDSSGGNDTLLGGRGNDVVLGQDGSDLLIVNNGDGSDF